LALKAENVSVSYRVKIDRGTPADTSGSRFRRPPDRIVRAVNGVSFDLPRGEVLAVIGRNGAGKSTLLRVLAGILVPDQGRVAVWGRISLFAIGLGFNSHLTGRANIMLGGLAQGIEPKQLERLAAQIGEFAQLGEFLDYPVHSYSTGMRSRLGFAVASHLDPDVLLIDEALGGGDAAYKDRAQARMKQMCSEGRTIVLVTHGLKSVKGMADRALWMHQGKVAAVSEDTDAVVARYMRFCRMENMALDEEG